jgi:hypothetical protein
MHTYKYERRAAWLKQDDRRQTVDHSLRQSLTNEQIEERIVILRDNYDGYDDQLFKDSAAHSGQEYADDVKEAMLRGDAIDELMEEAAIERVIRLENEITNLNNEKARLESCLVQSQQIRYRDPEMFKRVNE